MIALKKNYNIQPFCLYVVRIMKHIINNDFDEIFGTEYHIPNAIIIPYQSFRKIHIQLRAI